MLKWIIFPVMLIGLPGLGILLTDHPIEQYLEFPPRTLYVTPAAFSWVHFVAFSLLILAFTVPLLKRFTDAERLSNPGKERSLLFPGGDGWV